MSRLDRIIFDPDTVPPSTPNMNAALVVGQDRLDWSWSTATDTGGSGLAGYGLQLDGGSELRLGIQTSYSQTGLSPASLHTGRVRAFDGNNNPSPYSSQVSGTTSGVGLSWQTTIPTQNLTVGVPFSLDLDTLCTGALSYSLLSGSLPTGVTLDGATGVLSGTPTIAQSVSPTFRASSTSSSALADWTARATAAGVIWAQRFTQQSDVQGTSLGASPKSNAFSNIFLNATDGIIGDGCMEHFFPQGGLPTYGWNRPLFPVPGDANVAGLPVLPAGSYAQIFPEMFVNWAGGGHFVNASYESGGFSNESGKTTQRVRAGSFYVQFRVKFSASRFKSQEAAGKIMMIAGNYGNVNQEIVLSATTQYGGGWFSMYTNVGSGANAFLRNPQNLTGNPVYMQPGGLATCVMGDSQIGLAENGGLQHCWCYPTDTWVTLMIRVTPGHKAVTLSGDWLNAPANAGCKDTGIQVLAALPGATSWTTVMDFPGFIFDFGGDYISQSLGQPFGWNWINFTPFNGGSSSQPVISSTGWFHRFDQIICSTQPIALPAF
jgi:hypothetical protein